MSTPTVTIYCDGSVEPRNPGGFGCWGWIAFDGNGHAIEDNQLADARSRKAYREALREARRERIRSGGRGWHDGTQ